MSNIECRMPNAEQRTADDEEQRMNDERRTTSVERRTLASALRSSPFGSAGVLKEAGVRFAATMALYSSGMFALGFTRGDVVPMIGVWRVEQLMDAGIMVTGIAYIVLVETLLKHEKGRGNECE